MFGKAAVPCVALFILATRLSASTLYVPSQHATIQGAIDAAAAGDVVRVASGTYYENIWMKDGVDLIGSGAAGTKIVGNNNVIYGADNCTLSGFTITNNGQDRAGVYCSFASPMITRCIIVDCGQGQGQGIYCGTGTAPIIVNNTIAGNVGYGGIGVDRDASPIIMNNIIIDSDGQGGAGIYNWFGLPDISYNDVWNNAGGDYYGCSPGPGDISADPQFVGPGNYRLRPTSPCIDAGNPGDAFRDEDGTRNDMGALPYLPPGADLNLDKGVDSIDLGILVDRWGVEDALGDINRSGAVEAGDLGLLFSSWNPPAENDLVLSDSLSVGEPGSEAAHNLSSAPSSGTNVEGGYTRRYAGYGSAGAWFSYDLPVPAGVDRFVLRVAETYPEGSGVRNYAVLADGVAVYNREAAFGPVDETDHYDVEVSDASSMTADGVVTVTFQEEDPAQYHDPSVCAVWLLVPIQ